MSNDYLDMPVAEQITESGADHEAPDFVLRDLNASDVWQLVRILRAIGLSRIAQTFDMKTVQASRFKTPMTMKDGEKVPLPREEWTESQLKAEAAARDANEDLLWQILGFILDNIGACEYEVNKLLAMGIGSTPEAVAQLPADRYLALIEQYITRGGFEDFFSQAWRLLEKIGRSSASSAVMQRLTS